MNGMVAQNDENKKIKRGKKVETNTTIKSNVK